MSADFITAYNQAIEEAFIIRHPTPGIIRLTGEDRHSFLHRMSTNAIEAMPGWSVRATTLTTPLARTIDRLYLLNRQDDLIVLTSPGRDAIVRAWLEKHIFFNDDVQVTSPTHDWSLWGAYGPQAHQHVLELFDLESNPNPDQVLHFSDNLALGWRTPAGIRLLLAPTSESMAFDRWPDAASQVAAKVFTTLRVEAGYPLFDAEIDDDSLPLEVGLRSTIDFEKGCYTGQEIIARMESRGQLARQLVGIRLTEESKPGQLATGGGQIAGKLTSCADSPRFGWIGLGVIQTKHIDSHSSLVLAASGQPVEIVPLPFTSETELTPPKPDVV